MKMFGKYELGRLLGRGGFSEVFLGRFCAIDGFEKVLVVKIMLPNIAGNPEFVDLFISEAKVTAHLNHPNLVNVFDFGKVRDRYFMAMEYIKGLTLSELAARHAKRGDVMPPEIALYVAQEMARGLAYAHKAVDSRGAPLQAYHRDINPRNVFLTWDGNVKIADFGMVGILSVAEKFKGKAVGTIGFMSPEQAMGQATGAATDIFATGLVLYNLAVGKPAFDISDETACMNLMARAEFAPAAKAAPGLPKAISGIIERATKRRAEERYPTADEMTEEIADALYKMGRISEKTAAKYMDGFKERGSKAVSAALPAEVSAPEAPQPAPKAKPLILEVLYYFLIRGQEEPLGPLSLEEVRARLKDGELTGFEKASSDGVRWMKWQYFSDLAVMLSDPDRKKTSKPMSQVLLIFSDAAKGDGHAAALESRGFEVLRASSVREACEACHMLRPDAVLADVVTAGTGGFELLKALRADPLASGIPVVLVSPFGEKAVWSRGFRHGAADIVPASMEPGEVAERIRAVVDGTPFRTTGESGKLAPGLLDDLMSNIQKIRLSGLLSVSGGGVDGQVVFESGEVIEARVGSLPPEEAVQAMMSVGEGTYSFEEFGGARTPAAEAAQAGPSLSGIIEIREDRPLLWAETDPKPPFMFKPGGGIPNLLVQPVPFDDRLPETAANLRPCAVAIASLDTRAAAMKAAFRRDRRLLEIPIIMVSPILLDQKELAADGGLGMSPAAERIFAGTIKKTLSPTWTLRRVLRYKNETHSGRLQDVGAATLLESLAEIEFTGEVRLRGPFGEVSIGLERGGPACAFSEGAVRAAGREAFGSVFFWRTGDFTVSSRPLVEPANLQGGMTGLLDEAFDLVNNRIEVAALRAGADAPLKLSRHMEEDDLDLLSGNVKLIVALADEGLRPAELIKISGLVEDEAKEILTTLLALGAVM
jgi:serine/threonine protein kinase/CheY-like chemotaxis protein